MFCKHQWKMLSEITTESQMQHMRSLGGKPKEFTVSMLARKLIQIVTCTKCGKLKRYVDTI